jgi:hypothetical protein
MIFLSIISYSKILDKLSFYASGISRHLFSENLVLIFLIGFDQTIKSD